MDSDDQQSDAKDKQEHIEHLLRLEEMENEAFEDNRWWPNNDEERRCYNAAYEKITDMGSYAGMGTVFMDKEGKELEKVTVCSGEYFVKSEIFRKDGHRTKLSDVELTPSEKSDLERFEEVVRIGDISFIRAGLALFLIWKRRLYRGEFSSFKDYLDEKWGISRSRGYQLLLAATIYHSLTTRGIDVGLKSVGPLLALKGLNPEYAGEAYLLAKSEMKDNEEPPAWQIANAVRTLRIKYRKRLNDDPKEEPEDDPEDEPSDGSDIDSTAHYAETSVDVLETKRCMKPIQMMIKDIVTQEYYQRVELKTNLKIGEIIRDILSEQITILDEWLTKNS